MATKPEKGGTALTKQLSPKSGLNPATPRLRAIQAAHERHGRSTQTR